MNQSRVARLTEHARAQGWQAVVLVPGPDLYYLTGPDMHLSERPAPPSPMPA